MAGPLLQSPIPHVLLMLKQPRPGYCKTRLARDLDSPERAANIYRRLVERQLEELPCGWPATVHYAPADAGESMRAWLGTERACVPQQEGNLGDRMAGAMQNAFAYGAKSVLFLGGDCPEFCRRDFYDAADALRENDVVIAPARDGGYCMLATRRNVSRLFEDIAWSTAEVFSATRGRCIELGLRVYCLREMEDIDDLPSLQRSGFGMQA